MKYNCDVISDLIPLYVDQACTRASAEAVEEHVSECGACAAMLEEMQRRDTALDCELEAERGRVLHTQAKKFRRRSAVAGSIVGAIFSIPILVCLIVNLATGAGLTWFFIVLAAMLIPASLVVVPLMAPQDKFFWMVCSFTVSLLMLLGVCSIYSGGTWFMIAAPAVLFGLSVIFMPAMVHTKPVERLIRGNKALTVIAADTLTFALMMSCIGIRTAAPNFLRYVFAFALPPFAVLWGIYVLICVPKWNGLLKAAACVLLASLVFFFNDTFVYRILGGTTHFPTFGSVNDILCWIVLIAGTITAAILAVFGFCKAARK